MGTGYTRNDTSNNIADGNIINASDLDGEFDALQTAFDASSGHTHDGTTAEGAPIEVIGPSQDVVATASVLRPKTDNTVDLGTSSLEYKDLFLDGTAHIDTLDVDENASITGTLGVTGAVTANAGVIIDNITIDGTEIDLSSGDLTVDVAGDIVLDADGGDVLLKDAGTQYGSLTNSSGNLIVKSGSTTALTFSGANVTAAGNVTIDGNLDVTGTFDLSDSNFTNAGNIQLDSISGDADTDTSITFSGSDVITVATGGTTSFTVDASQNILMNAAQKVQFRDTALTINSSTDGQLDIDADTEVEITAPTVDINASTAVTVSNDLKLDSDAAVLGFGADNDVTLTHVADTGLLLNGTSVIQFNDASQKIGAPNATTLDIDATDEIELNATLVDVNANLDVSGTYTGAGLMTTGGNIVIPDAGTIGSASDTDAIAIGADGDVTLTQDLELQHDAATLSFGADNDVVLTHVADTGLLLNSTMALQFNDASQFINAPSATVLDINATDEVELNATLVDVNANLDVSGTYTGGGLMTTGGNIVIPDAGNIGSASDTDAIAIASDGQVTLTQTLTGTAANFSGVATATTFEPDGDTAAGDNAAIGYTAAEGLILTGQGSTSDITFKNDADTTVFSIPTGTDDVLFPDNAKAMFGAGSDLSVYHDGTRSHIEEAGLGGLWISTNGTEIKLKQGGGVDEEMLVATPNGSVDLYYNNNLKLATTSTGIDVTGNATFADNGKAIFGAGSDLQIYHDGSNSIISDQGTGHLKIHANDFRVTNSGNTEQMITADQDGEVALYYDSVKKFETSSSGIDVTGTVTADGLTVGGDGLFDNDTAKITVKSFQPKLILDDDSAVGAGSDKLIIQSASSQSAGDYEFVINNDQTSSADQTAIKISGNGDISFYEDTGSTAKLTWDASAESLKFADDGQAIFGDSSDLTIEHNGTNSTITNATGTLTIQNTADDEDVDIVSDDGSGGTAVYFRADGSSGQAKLYHNNAGTGTLRLNTSSDGIDITGHADIEGHFTATDGCTITTADNSTQLTLTSTDADSSEGPRLDLRRDSASPANGDLIGTIRYLGDDDGGTTTVFGEIQLEADAIADGSESGQMRLMIRNNGTLRNAVVIDATEVLFNQSNDDVDFRVESDTNTHALFVQGSSGNVGIGGSPVTALDVRGEISVDYDATYGLRFYNEDRNNWSSIGNPTATGDSTANLVFKVSSGEAMRIDSSGNVGIGVTNVIGKIHADDSGGATLTLTRTSGATSGNLGKLRFGNTNVDSALASIVAIQDGATDNSAITFGTQSSGAGEAEAMRIDSSGNVLVGDTSATFNNTAKTVIRPSSDNWTIKPAVVHSFNRTGSDGDILEFYRTSSTKVGSIKVDSGNLSITGEGSTKSGLMFGGNINPLKNGVQADNAIDLGTSSHRFDDIYATNGTIQTSDRNEKQDIEELTDAEQRVAVAAKGLLRKFRWKSAVAEKGDKARTHFGIIAQDLQAAFAAEGLDAGDYAMFISTTWWEHQVEVPAVEADEENNIEAVDAYTRTDTYDTAEEAPEGATERTRMGVRYSELLAFIIAAI